MAGAVQGSAEMISGHFGLDRSPIQHSAHNARTLPDATVTSTATNQPYTTSSMSGSGEASSSARAQISGEWDTDAPTRLDEVDHDFEAEADEFGPTTYALSREAKRRKWWRDAIINSVYIASW